MGVEPRKRYVSTQRKWLRAGQRKGHGSRAEEGYRRKAAKGAWEFGIGIGTGVGRRKGYESGQMNG